MPVWFIRATCLFLNISFSFKKFQGSSTSREAGITGLLNTWFEIFTTVD
jgi:hypothetical protein